MTPIVWTAAPVARALQGRFQADADAPKVRTADEYLAVQHDAAVGFLDGDALGQLQCAVQERGLGGPGWRLPVPVIAVCEGPLAKGIAWLCAHPWLGNVVSASTLAERATGPLDTVVESLAARSRPRLLDWVRPSLTGKRARLTRASEAGPTLERMREVFAQEGVDAAVIDDACEAADELLTNAFYEAPLAAQIVLSPLPRNVDVALPESRPCDVVYGCTEDLAIVRVRDPFGSLSRTRVVESLRTGLGLWRVFSAASFVAISVAKGHHTDVLFGMRKQPVPAAERPFAFHLFFKDSAKKRSWRLFEDDAQVRTFTTSTTYLGES